MRDRVVIGIGERERAVGAAAPQDLDQRAFAVGVRALAGLPVALGDAHLIGVDHCQVHPRCAVRASSRTSRSIHALSWSTGAPGLVGDAVEPIGERVALLPQHRQEQLVLGLEVAVERPGGHPGALQDRGDRDRAGVRLRKATVCRVDDAAAVVVTGGVWLHDRRF